MLRALGFKQYLVVFIALIAASVSGCSKPTLPSAPAKAKAVAVQPTVISVTTDNFSGRYTTGSQINIDVNFSAPILVTGTPQLTLNTSPSHALNFISSSKSKMSFTYTVSAGDSQTDAWLDYANGTALSLNSGTIMDAATNTLAANLSLPNSGVHTSGLYVRNIFIDTAPLTVTLNQAATQADPTNTKPIAFTAVFNKPINLSSFSTSDITQSGTAAVTAWSIVNSDGGLNQTFTLTATAITSGSPEVIVKPSLQAGVVQDLAGNSNTFSTSTDNKVTYDTVTPSIAISTPANNSWINIATNSAAFAVSGTCTEGNQAEVTGRTITIQIDGTNAGTALCTGAGTFSTTVNTTSLSQAAHSFSASITDLAGNSATSSLNSVTKDITSPTVVVAGPAGSNPANSSGSTNYTLTFSDTNLGTIVNTTINSGITINGASAGCTKSTTVSGTSATVTITGCTGNGTANIIVGTTAWSDLAGNPLTLNSASSTFTVNNTLPSIAITTPANNSWINSTSDSASFAVSGTCTEPTQSAVTGQTVTIKIDGVTSGTALCTVGGLFSGTINSTTLTQGAHIFTATITDIANNSSTSISNSVTKDTISPTVLISGASVSPINSSASTVYTLTFTDTNLGTIVNTTINSGITINGTNTGCTKSTTVSGAVATVTITGCSGNGTASITVNSTAWSDLAGNTLTANGPSATFTVDNTAPTIAIISPVNNSWINSTTDSSTFGVSGTCSETGQTVTIKVDGTANGTATCNGTTFASTNVNTTGLSQAAHTFTATLADTSGNSNSSSGISITRDVTAPVVVVTGPTGSNPANAAASTIYTLTFSDTNLGTIINTTINAGITINGTNTGCTKTTTVSGAVATVTITGCSGNGTTSITVNSTAWSDQAGNTLTANGPSSTFTVDNTAPTIAITTPANNSWISSASDSSSFGVSGTCSEAGRTVTIKIDGTNNGTAICTGTTFASTNVNTTTLTQAAHLFTATISDVVGNSTTSSNISATRDVTAPVVSISSPSVSTIKSTGSTVYTLTFTDTNLGTLVNTTINSGITINGANTGCTKSTTVAGAVATVTITNCSGNGTASITVGSTAWKDQALNVLTANGPSSTFTVDNTVPTIAITTPANNSWINSTTDSSSYTVSGSCSEAGQTVTIKINGTNNGTATCNGTTFTSTNVDTTSLSEAAHTFTASISDTVGNTTISSGVSVTRDVTDPTVIITGPGGSDPTNSSGSTTFTLSFTDSNLGTLNNSTINSGITINGTNTGCTKTTTNAGATSKTVTITGCSGDGTASISVGSTAWVDLAGNALTAVGPSSTFTINNNLPSIAITTPANNSWINSANNSSTFTVSGTCVESIQSELTSQTVTIKIDNNTAGTTTCSAGGTFSATVDSTALSESNHIFTASVTDLASNSATSPNISITQDVTAPTVVISGPSGNNPTNFSGSTTYSLTFSDSNSIAPVNATVNSAITINGSNSGCSKSTSCSGNSCTVTLTGCTTVSGTASISIDASGNSDQAGNALTANGPSSTFTINNSLPTIAITSPANNSWINIANDSSSFSVSGTCTESTQSQLTGQTVTIKIDGTIAGSGTCAANGTFSGNVNTTGLTETAHSFTATVTDLASNIATSLTKTITRDVTPPTVGISAPTGSASYTLTFSDSNLSAPVDATVSSAITINGANTGCVQSVSGCTSNSCIINITGCTDTAGSASISVDSSAIKDQSGNALTPNGPSISFIVN